MAEWGGGGGGELANGGKSCFLRAKRLRPTPPMHSLLIYFTRVICIMALVAVG